MACDRRSGQLEGRETCKRKRCELLGSQHEAGEVAAKDGPESGIGYVTGNVNCFRVVIGKFASCFKENMGYEGNELDCVNCDARHPDSTNWGQCAKKCSGVEACKFWSLASSTCTNCYPGRCHLYGAEAR